MAGIYDWILNSLKVDQSPLTNQLPTPIPAQNITGLPVPFQQMPSESASYNPFMKLNNMFTNLNVNPMIPQDAGTNPTAPNDPLKTASTSTAPNMANISSMLAKMMGSNGMGSSANSSSKTPVIPPQATRVGNPTTPNFTGMSPLNVSAPSGSTRSAMLMKMLQQMPMDYGVSE